MMDTMSELRNNLASSIIDKKEQVYKDAIAFVSDGKEWTNDEIRKRCTIEIMQQTRVEIFLIDGVPMVEFHPMEFNTTNEDLSYKMNMSFKCRELYKEEK